MAQQTYEQGNYGGGLGMGGVAPIPPIIGNLGDSSMASPVTINNIINTGTGTINSTTSDDDDDLINTQQNQRTCVDITMQVGVLTYTFSPAYDPSIPLQVFVQGQSASFTISGTNLTVSGVVPQTGWILHICYVPLVAIPPVTNKPLLPWIESITLLSTPAIGANNLQKIDLILTQIPYSFQFVKMYVNADKENNGTYDLATNTVLNGHFAFTNIVGSAFQLIWNSSSPRSTTNSGYQLNAGDILEFEYEYVSP